MIVGDYEILYIWWCNYGEKIFTLDEYNLFFEVEKKKPMVALGIAALCYFNGNNKDTVIEYIRQKKFTEMIETVENLLIIGNPSIYEFIDNFVNAIINRKNFQMEVNNIGASIIEEPDGNFYISSVLANEVYEEWTSSLNNKSFNDYFFDEQQIIYSHAIMDWVLENKRKAQLKRKKDKNDNKRNT